MLDDACRGDVLMAFEAMQGRRNKAAHPDPGGAGQGCRPIVGIASLQARKDAVHGGGAMRQRLSAHRQGAGASAGPVARLY